MAERNKQITDIAQHRERQTAKQRQRKSAAPSDPVEIAEKMGGPPAILNTCLAYGTDSPVIQRRWPHLYTGRVAE